MNKTDTINKFAQTLGIKTSESKTQVEALFGLIKDALLDGEEVTLPGIGKLKVKTRPARNGRNPKTGETITIPEKKVVKFSAASEFDNSFNHS